MFPILLCLVVFGGGIVSLITIAILDRVHYDNAISEMMKNEACQCNMDVVDGFARTTVYCKDKVDTVFARDDSWKNFAGGNRTCYPDRPVVNSDSIHYPSPYYFLGWKKNH